MEDVKREAIVYKRLTHQTTLMTVVNLLILLVNVSNENILAWCVNIYYYVYICTYACTEYTYNPTNTCITRHAYVHKIYIYIHTICSYLLYRIQDTYVLGCMRFPMKYCTNDVNFIRFL